jgi:hypothetical protein
LFVIVERPLSPFVMSVSLGSEPRSVEVIWMADFEDNIFVKKFIVYAQSFSAGNIFFESMLAYYRALVELSAVPCILSGKS